MVACRGIAGQAGRGVSPAPVVVSRTAWSLPVVGIQGTAAPAVGIRTVSGRDPTGAAQAARTQAHPGATAALEGPARRAAFPCRAVRASPKARRDLLPVRIARGPRHRDAAGQP
jgi:hypothetical protein